MKGKIRCSHVVGHNHSIIDNSRTVYNNIYLLAYKSLKIITCNILKYTDKAPIQN